MVKIQNPILPGFNADPSLIRVGDAYYIATSTFEWFPGVRIHESKDLKHWKLVKNVLNTTALLDMKGNPSSGGIWAPDLSYADGKFWLVYTDVKVTEGAFKDMTNYLTTAPEIQGPWSAPIKLNGVGFDASLFHDDDGRKYLVQQTWDHREYHHQFDGITLTEFDVLTMKLKSETARTIYRGTHVKLVEGPHIYRLNGYYYLFAAEGGTVWAHQETVSRSRTLDADSFETMPDNPLISNVNTADSILQKQGHGSLVNTPGGEWYYASLTGRPLNHPNECSHDPRGWSPLGRETALQKVYWDEDQWPRIVGGQGGLLEIDGPLEYDDDSPQEGHSRRDEFNGNTLDINWNTLRVPFNREMGTVGNGTLTLIGKGSLANEHELSLVARRWQAFRFIAETRVKFNPKTYQAMAGLTNYYNSRHWSFIFITYDEKNKIRVIEIAENNRGRYTSYLKDNSIPVPDNVEYVYLRTLVRDLDYAYQYSFDGNDWKDTGVNLDSAVLSDEYVLSSYGGFFTGAFVGLAAVDYSGYDATAEFDFFDYKEVIT